MSALSIPDFQKQTTPARKALAVMSDLFFSAMVIDTAKKFGMTVEIVRNHAAALEKIREKPAVLVLDLNCAEADPVGLLLAIKANPDMAGIRTLGFVSHVQTELRQRAQAAGCDMVVARSVFAQKLPEIFQPVA